MNTHVDDTLDDNNSAQTWNHEDDDDDDDYLFTIMHIVLRMVGVGRSAGYRTLGTERRTQSAESESSLHTNVG